MLTEQEKALKAISDAVSADVNSQVGPLLEDTKETIAAAKKTIEEVKALSSFKAMDTKLKEAIGNELKALHGKELPSTAVRMKDFIAGDEAAGDGSGANLMGAQIFGAVIDAAKNYGKLYKDASMYFTNQRDFVLIKGDNLPIDTAGFVAEGADVDEDKLLFDKDTLTVEAWYRVIAVGKATLEDSAVDLAAYVIGELGKNAAAFLDSQVASVMQASTTQEVALATGTVASQVVTLEKFLATLALLSDAYRERAKVYLSFVMYVKLRTAKDGANQYILDITKDSSQIYVEGRPIVIADELNQAVTAGSTVFFVGDLADAVAIVMRKEFTIEKGEKFLANLVYFKGTMRCKVASKIATALAKCKFGPAS